MSGTRLTPAKLIARTGNLASLPSVFQKVNEVMDRPNSSAADIARAIGTDQSVSARLLRIANSAFYGFPSRVDSIEQAVVVIGTRQLRDLMVSTLAIGQFRGIDPKMCDMSQFWRHSFACALACRALASRRRETNSEQFFLAGLLHDLGSLVLYQYAPEVASEVLLRHQTDSIPLHESEWQVMGFDHALVGSALLASWKLPMAVREATEHHHRFSLKTQGALGAAMVQIADLIVHAMIWGTNGERFLPPLDATAWEMLGLPTTVLEGVVEDVEARLGAVESLFLGQTAGA